jgi:hypothetical protein
MNGVSGVEQWRHGRNNYYAVRIKLSATANIRIWVGYMDAAQSKATMAASDNPANAQLAALHYCNDAAAGCASDLTNWECVTKDGTTINTADAGVPPGTSAYTLLEFVEHSSVPSWEMKIDGASVCTMTSNLPGSITGTQIDNVITITTLIAGTAVNVRRASSYNEGDMP